MINSEIAFYHLISFSGVQCSDTVEGAQCGQCPQGYEGDGKVCQQRRSACQDNPCAAGIKDIHVIATWAKHYWLLRILSNFYF